MATAKVHPVSDEFKLANNNNDEHFATEPIKRKYAYQGDSDTEDGVAKESTSVEKDPNSVEAPGSDSVHKAVPTRDVIHQRFLTAILIILVLVSVASHIAFNVFGDGIWKRLLPNRM